MVISGGSDEMALENPNPSGLFLAGFCEKPVSVSPQNTNAKTGAKIRQDRHRRAGVRFLRANCADDAVINARRWADPLSDNTVYDPTTSIASWRLTISA